MTSDSPDSQAADWYARLNRRAVSAQTLREFNSWRQKPANAAAYAAVEAMWQQAGVLGADPEIGKALERALERPAGAPQRAGRLIALAAALIATVAIAVLLLATRPAAYSTEVGERRLVQLDDGSRLYLNTDSRADARFAPDRRTVELARGQALFDVAPDAERPFVVVAGSVEVRALGTRFDVRRDGARTQVTLLEGRVEVRDHRTARRLELAPGQQVTLGDTRTDPPKATDLAAATSWTTGRVLLRRTPLATAVAEVNRYSRVKVALADTVAPDTPVSGVFDAGDTEAFVTAVTAALPLTASRPAADQIVLSSS